jgi:hypothetical protein
MTGNGDCMTEEIHTKKDSSVGDLRKHVATKWRIGESLLRMAVQKSLENEGEIHLCNDDNVMLTEIVGGRISRVQN